MLMFLIAFAWADCVVTTSVKPVGWNADHTSVILRAETKDRDENLTKIELATWPVGKWKASKTWTIMDFGGTAAERGENWKAAEAELLEQGFTFTPDARPEKLGALSRDGLHYSRLRLEGDYVGLEAPAEALVISRGGESAILTTIGLHDEDGQWSHYIGPWRVPDSNTILFTLAECNAAWAQWADPTSFVEGK